MRRRREALAFSLIVLALAACKPGKKTTAENLELTERYRVKSGLAVAHHPKVLAPAQVNDSVARLAPATALGPFDADVEIFISTTNAPATSVLDEYVRILHAPLEADMRAWSETSRKASSCLGVYAGIELTATFLSRENKKLRYWSCTFMHGGHGYKVAYVVPDSAASHDAPLLRKVIDATEVLN